MYYPLMVNLKNKNICIVGAGEVSLRKAKKFLEYEANVTVISIEFKDEFYELKEQYHDKIKLIKDEYKEEYLHNTLLVEVATDNHFINEEIARLCNKKNILCNVVDNKTKSDVIIPSTVKRGDLIISISTLGNSPSFCSRVRKELEKKYDSSTEEFIRLLGEGRELVLHKIHDKSEKKRVLNSMAYMEIEELKQFIIRMKG